MPIKQFIFFKILLITLALYAGESLFATSLPPKESKPQLNKDSTSQEIGISVPAIEKDSLLKKQNEILEKTEKAKTDTADLARDATQKSSEILRKAFESLRQAPDSPAINPDSLQQAYDSLQKAYATLKKDFEKLKITSKPTPSKTKEKTLPNNKANKESLKLDSVAAKENVLLIDHTPFLAIQLDSIALRSNPLFIDLVYMGIDVNFEWRKDDKELLFEGKKPTGLANFYEPIKTTTPLEILSDLRKKAKQDIAHNQLHLFKTTFDQLPKLSWNTNELIESTLEEKIYLKDKGAPVITTEKIKFRKRDFGLWNSQVNSLLQFSQIHVSDNWHKGGNGYLMLLGIITARMDYDDKKSIKWENSIELRTGFNTVDQDSLRSIITSDDRLKANSKFGYKAGGKIYYSSSLDLQTQFYNNPKKINSRELKASFLTPLRFNLGLGIDYKPNKNLSIAISPASYKVIYLANTKENKKHPEATINPNSFGIEKGKNLLSEFGSKVVLVLKDYKPIPDLKINSRFFFYTNYKKVELDWEIETEYAINRFFSTRLMLNPRFDNTVILKNDEKARIQMKELLTIGISYRIY